MDIALEWRDLDSLDSTTHLNVLIAIRQLVQHHPEATMDHNLDWLFAKRGDGKSVKVFICLTSEGTLIGYAPFFVHPSTLSFELFGLSFFEYPIRRYCITAGPLLAADFTSQELFWDLFIKLQDILGNRDVVFGLGVPLSSHFGRFVVENKDLKKIYQIFSSSNAYLRRFIVFPETFDEYVKNLSYNTRKEVRRVLRNLESDIKLTASYRVFTSSVEVPEFLALVQLISDKTYQRKLLNLGTSNNDYTCHILTSIAERSWLRGYVLFCKGEPVAYKLGYLYNGTYISEQVGYDPLWSNWSVGTVMHMYVVKDLINNGAEKFDFMYGDAENKRKLSNTFRKEQNFYIVPHKFPLAAIALTLRAFNFMIDKLGKILEKFGIKTLIRRFLRRHATTSPEKK